MEWSDWHYDDIEPTIYSEDSETIGDAYCVFPQPSDDHRALDAILAALYYLMGKYAGDPTVDQWMNEVEALVGA